MGVIYEQETWETEVLGNLRLLRHWQGMGQSWAFLAIHMPSDNSDNYSNSSLTTAR